MRQKLPYARKILEGCISEELEEWGLYGEWVVGKLDSESGFDFVENIKSMKYLYKHLIVSSYRGFKFIIIK